MNDDEMQAARVRVESALKMCRVERGFGYPSSGGAALGPWCTLLEALAEMVLVGAAIEHQAPEPDPPEAFVCAGCGSPGSSTSTIPADGRALHWVRRGKWVCLSCKDK